MFLDTINSHGNGKLPKTNIGLINIKANFFSTTKFTSTTTGGVAPIHNEMAVLNKNNLDELELKLYESDSDFDSDFDSNSDSNFSNDIMNINNINNKLSGIKFKKDINYLNMNKIDKKVNRTIKLKKAERKKKQLAKFTGGYKSYENKTVLGNLLALLSIESLNEVLKNKLFVEFKENRGYSILIQLDYLSNGILSGLSPMKSMYITHDTNVNLISVNIFNALNKVINEYNIEGEVCRVSVIWKDWEADLDYSKMVEPVLRTQIVEEVLREQAKVHLKSHDKLCQIMKFMKQSKLTNYINEFPTFDSITMLDVYNNSELFDFIKDLCPNIKVTIYKANNYIDTGVLYFVFDIIPSKKRLICIGDIKSWKSTLVYWNSPKYPYIKWTDVFINENAFTRYIGDYKYHIDNGDIKFWEKIYNFPDMIMGYTDKNYNNKIGAIDFETYGNHPVSGGLGKLSVFSGGVALNTGYYEDYIIDPSKGLNNGDDIIIKLFQDLFNYISEDKKSRNGYTLYAHNLGRFDSIFILNSLSKTGFDVNASWAENDILYIKIRDKERKLTVKLKDSIKMVPTSLDKMLKTFNCSINKGLFPHKFVCKDNLNYIGPKPDIKYYFDDYKITESKLNTYNNLPETFNLKKDCLEYLKSDVMGLLEAMEKISLYYFENFNFNITKFNTLPSLALAIFGFGYKDNEHKIKMIKGPLEKFITEGIVKFWLKVLRESLKKVIIMI